MADSSKQISLKVLIHRQEERVLFAEADSDFVDILFSFLTMPMGTIVRLLSKQSQPPAIGSFNNLYKSIANLDAKYFASEECKDMLLNTRNSAELECEDLKINIDDIKPMDYFTCENMDCTENNHPAYLSIHNCAICRHCCSYLTTKAHVIDFPISFEDRQAGGVFIRPTASYVITHDLQVFPGFPASILEVLKSFKITDCGVLEEKTFNIGSTEILNLLKFSVLSKSPLTSLLLGKNCIAIDNSFQNIICEKWTEIISFKKMTVKVFVQKSNGKILLAHSSEDFIDFLFNCLAIPLGRFSSLFSKDNAPVLGVKNIQQSVSDLKNANYFKLKQLKDILLFPQMDSIYACSKRVFPIKEDIVRKFCYSRRCSYIESYYVYSHYQVNNEVDRDMTLISPMREGGYLKGLANFMVTDDLVVNPFSLISCVSYIATCNVPPSDIEEQVIEIGIEEATNLMRASLISTTVLTIGLKHLIQSNPCTNRTVKRPKVED